MIIDFHMHLGDILHEAGIKNIYSNKKIPTKFNIQRFEEVFLQFNSYKLTNYILNKYDDFYTRSVQERLKAATLQNYRKYLKKLKSFSLKVFSDQDVKSLCMPISPYVNFDDILALSKEESAIIPFASIPIHLSGKDMLKKLNADMTIAKGLKLHPIIQGVPFDSKTTYSALEIVKSHKKVVLLHAGASRYYLGEEKHLQHCELDNPYSAEKIIRCFPEVPFIIGHAGIYEFPLWAEIIAKYENVLVDVSVQSIKSIRNIINLYGIDRVLFASGWPCVDLDITLKIIQRAINVNQLEKVLYKNALDILI